MAPDSDETETPGLSPEAAFTALGNETRMEILQALGRADRPLSFSDLHDRISLRDSGQFNYHLGKLTGHFVQQTDEGYSLSQAGNRVVEAVLSGAITDAPVLGPTVIDLPCPYCSAPTIVGYYDGTLRHYCTECQGTYGDGTVVPNQSQGGETEAYESEKLGFLGGMVFPPAGTQGRTPIEVFEATVVWGGLEFLAMGRGICPRCSAPVERSVASHCEDHDTSERVCEHCDSRYAVLAQIDCSNCDYNPTGTVVSLLLGDRDVMTFLSTHGIDPLTDRPELDWDEEILGTDPFEARYTCVLDEDALTVTIDESLNVVDVRTGQS